MSYRGPYEMASLGTALGFACRSLFGNWRGGCDEHFVYVFIITCTCRCSSDDKTALSTSVAAGPATKKDSATCLENSGLVGERLIQNPFNMLV